MYDTMARITIELTWARLNDFETTLPKEVERILARKHSSHPPELPETASAHPEAGQTGSTINE